MLVNAFVPAMILLASTSLPAKEPVRILVLGDSLAAGFGLAAPDSFPAKLEAGLKAVGIAATVINGGVSGETTAGGLARLSWMLDGAKADAVIVELGANDGLRGLDPRATRANLDTILARLRARNLPVLLAGMRAPPNLGPEFGAGFEALYPELARKHDAVLYPFFLDGVAAVPELNQDDRIHPNARGVDVIVQRILPFVRTLLLRVR